MGPDATIAAPSGSLLGAVERVAWRIRLPSRTLFLGVALAVALALVAGSAAAAWLAARNAETIADVRETGLGIASSATDFRTNLAAADAEAATTLIAGGLESPEGRGRYEQDLLEAEGALVTAGLVAPAEDEDDIAALGDGLIIYAGLVETARANSRQGFPVGAAYLNQARALARDDLVPRADRLRRAGERRVAEAANSVGGPLGAVAIALPVAGLAVLVAGSAVIAGRTRHALHPALLAAAAAGIGALVVVTTGVLAQGRELRAAATGDIDAYVAANDSALTLSNMRVAEIAAVAARGSGATFYESVREDGSALVDRLAADGEQGGLLADVEGYVAAVEQVESTDTDGDNAAAADITLDEAATAFTTANDAADGAVDRAEGDLRQRFDDAADADLHPLLPVALGVVAAALAAAGVLARGRRYR